MVKPKEWLDSSLFSSKILLKACNVLLPEDIPLDDGREEQCLSMWCSFYQCIQLLHASILPDPMKKQEAPEKAKGVIVWLLGAMNSFSSSFVLVPFQRCCWSDCPTVPGHIGRTDSFKIIYKSKCRLVSES